MTPETVGVGCPHDGIATSELMADGDGLVREVGLCAGCRTMLCRNSPLDPWTPIERDKD